MESNQITFEVRYFMREAQMFACFQSLAIKKNVWNCATGGKEIELSKTMWRFWSGCHVLTKGEEVGPLGHKKFVSINSTSQGSSALDIEPGMRNHEKRNCAGFNVKEENYWRAILLSPFPSLQFDKSLVNFLVSGRMLNKPRWFLFPFFGFDRRRLFDMAKENNACDYWGQMGKYPP